MKLLILCLLLTGCSNMIVRSELGIGTSGYLTKSVQPSGKRLTAINIGTKIGPEIFLTDDLKLDLFIGPTITTPIKGDLERAFNIEIAPRLRFIQWEIQPYVMPFVGPSYMPERWGNQASNWGFNLGVATGIRKKITEEYWAFIEYKFWHESNGASVFRHGKEPNPGFNMNMVTLGLEWKW